MDKYASILKWWRAKEISSAAALRLALNGYNISFAYNSGKIENDRITYNDTREIFEHDAVSSYTGDLRTLFEIRNSKAASEYFFSAFDCGAALDAVFIKELQKHLTENTYDTYRYQSGERPGEYKKHDYVTGREEVGAAPEDVEAELSELLSELESISDDNALTAAAYFHVKFENIHPYADGNGRVGRLAMNYFLVKHAHPPVTIHEEDRKEYYDALEAWDKEQQLLPMEAFLRSQTVKTWESQAERAKNPKPKTNISTYIF